MIKEWALRIFGLPIFRFTYVVETGEGGSENIHLPLNAELAPEEEPEAPEDEGYGFALPRGRA